MRLALSLSDLEMSTLPTISASVLLPSPQKNTFGNLSCRTVTGDATAMEEFVGNDA